MCTRTFMVMRMHVRKFGRTQGGRMVRIARAQISLLSLFVLLAGCVATDEVALYRNADVERMPRSIDDLKLIGSDNRLAQILTPLRGRHSVIRYIETSSGIPMMNDSGSRRTIVVVLNQPSPTLGRSEVGRGIVAAYLTAGAPNRPVDSYCLGLAIAGFVDLQTGRDGGYDIYIDLSFSEINPAGFEGVCHSERDINRIHRIKFVDLKTL